MQTESSIIQGRNGVDILRLRVPCTFTRILLDSGQFGHEGATLQGKKLARETDDLWTANAGTYPVGRCVFVNVL